MNKLPICGLILLLMLAGSSVFAQSQNQGTTREPSGASDRGATYDVEMSKRKKKGKSANSLASQYDKKVEEHNELMKANAKKNEKLARQMEKPQYSDPTYFGHKKEPRKRPPGKKKFCKECGMVH